MLPVVGNGTVNVRRHKLIRFSHRPISDVTTSSLDVDFIKNIESLRFLHFHAHCWDRPAGLKSVKVSLGTFPYGDDVYTEVLKSFTSRVQHQPSLKPGIKYYHTLDVEDYAGWITRQTSDGFTIDVVSLLMFDYSLCLTSIICLSKG